MRTMVESLCTVALRHATRVMVERRTMVRVYSSKVVKGRAPDWQRIHEDAIITIANQVIALRTIELEDSQ